MESAKTGSTWHLRGALTGPSCDLVRAAARRLAAGRDLLLDLREVKDLDRPGLGALLAAVTRVRFLGGSVRMRASEEVADVAHREGLDRLVQFLPASHTPGTTLR